MTGNAHLWAVGYEDMHRAEQVRAEMTNLGERHCLKLLDMAVAVRYPDGSVTVDGEPYVATCNFTGHTFAKLLSWLSLGAPPLTGAAATALVGRRGRDLDVGIDCAFIGAVQGFMKPGTSVLFVLDQVGDLPASLEGIEGLGGTVLKTNVDLERAKLVQSTLVAEVRP
jgi:uncharacterized membrane protein